MTVMLIKAKALNRYKLHCLDGEIGSVKEFVFDELHWTVRYLVAETGNWLLDRQVLISPHSLTHIDKESKFIKTDLTKQQIEDSPSLYKDLPISRQFEGTYFQYYGFPTYWNGPYVWGNSPGITRNSAVYRTAVLQGDKMLDSGLRSTFDVDGRRIHATDGEIGHVDDFIIDDETWTIRYLVINTQNWWPGKKVLISPEWIDHIAWDEFKVYVNVLREKIKASPEYTDETELNRDYEHGLHEHYERRGYWDDSITDKNSEE